MALSSIGTRPIREFNWQQDGVPPHWYMEVRNWGQMIWLVSHGLYIPQPYVVIMCMSLHYQFTTKNEDRGMKKLLQQLLQTKDLRKSYL
ncbi:hypothetical protein C0J52_07795 [Blattella germanica]|nr:hypothetical protein C0J52_07795 [Blattella germanica]